ncbi:MAG: hypothetical protein NZ839_04765 [Endomicrobia bacterium]|nr:hypothetical protein [Endomicrobiia bacterium]
MSEISLGYEHITREDIYRESEITHFASGEIRYWRGGSVMKATGFLQSLDFLFQLYTCLV